MPAGTEVRVGTIVRVPLHGRRVRGWVVAVEVEPEVEELQPLLGVVSDGPDAAMLSLAGWVAHRWGGPLTAVLRSASPPNRVAVRPNLVTPRAAPARAAPAGAALAPEVARLVADASARRSVVVRWPPLRDGRDLVGALLPADGSTIVATADGRRARALVAWLRTRGCAAVELHSERSDADRTAAWARAAAGSCVVVGGRIAALAPVPDLAAAIVVDDADEALQEERSPTWHARDVLVERARRAGARVVHLSPAPTVSALAHADVVALPPAHEASGWPRVEVVDRRSSPPGAGLFPDEVAAELRAGAAAGDPVVCVVNRRGRVRLLACGGCGHLLRPEPSWWEADDVPRVCPACGATRLRVVRVGVTRLGEELEALLPRARVVDVDAASGPVPDDATVVVGTEAVLHRAELVRRRPRLVAFLDFDQELHAPRLRTAEQALWLVVRAARLLRGRPRGESRVLLQTRDPAHVVVEAARHGDPARVAASEAARRRELGLPPFGALAELRGAPEAVHAALAALEPLAVFGPREAGAGLAALVSAPDPDALADALGRALPTAREHGRLRVVVDPPRA